MADDSNLWTLPADLPLFSFFLQKMSGRRAQTQEQKAYSFIKAFIFINAAI